MRALLAAAALASLAGCATTMADEPPMSDAERMVREDGIPERGAASGRACREPSSSWIGQAASQEIGARIAAETGARSFRWLVPGQIVTMEFRADRVNVELDASNRITAVRCG